MKKTKRMLFAIATATIMMTAAGCSGKTIEAPTAAQEQTSISAPDTEETTLPAESEPAKESLAETKNSEEKQLTGILDENKGFMFIIKSDVDGESYIFDMEQENQLDGFNSGDKITVTYTGEDPVVGEITDTTLVKVEQTES